MISHKYKCIFIHIPKTAGTSIENKLELFKDLQRGVQDHRTIREIEKSFFTNSFTGFCNGDIIRHFKRRLKNRKRGNQYISRRHYNDYFKFTFVRNSWSRVYSWYQNLMRDEIHKRNLGVSDGCSFREVLEKYPDHWGLNSQLYWITNEKGKIPLDFIGRFENLEDDFAHVCNVIQLKDKSLPKLIVSKNSKPYTQFYDDHTKRIVSEKYADEISFFNFKFGE